MIKYFDFESDIELLEKKFESLDQNKLNNSKIIDSLNQEKKQLYKIRMKSSQMTAKLGPI